MPSFVDIINKKRKSEYITGTSGYVYVIKSPVGVKIGCSIDPEKRTKTIDRSLPFDTYLVAIIPCGDMYFLEKEIHRYFSHKSIKGEWFALNDEDLAVMEDLIPDAFIYKGRAEQTDDNPF